MLPSPNAPDRPPLTLLVGGAARSLPRRRLSAEGKRKPQRIQLTPRDVAIAQDLVRFYGLTAEQVARRHFTAGRTAANRLAELAAVGYVQLERPWYRGLGVYVATRLGTQLADVGLPAPPFRPLRMAHHLAVADLAEILLRKYAHVDGIAWICERELHQAAMAMVRDRDGGRLLAGVEHVPDGVLTTPSARWAVEVELSKKGDVEYLRIFRWYAAQRDYRRVAWYAGAEPVRRRIEALIGRERLDDFMTVLPLPEGVTVYSWGR